MRRSSRCGECLKSSLKLFGERAVDRSTRGAAENVHEFCNLAPPLSCVAADNSVLDAMRDVLT